MFIIAHRPDELSVSELKEVYQNDSATVRYLLKEFFNVDGAVCCVLRENGEYVSILRLEPYLDGHLISGLETTPLKRRQGYATKLLQNTITQLQPLMLYSHIDNRNIASKKFHQKFGFEKVLDFAKYIDGTVSANASTYALMLRK